VIVLVRHAMPLVDPDVDPASWLLSSEGEAAARALSDALPTDAVLVSSDEPKAHATLALATGREVITDARLREVARPREPYRADFAVARLAYVDGLPPPGWEPQTAVVARIDAAIAAHRVPGRPLVLGGHGMAFTTWLSAYGLVNDPVAFWSALRLPDVFNVLPRGEQ
jgi:broad specificity phosphatase PhoE